MTVGMPCKVCGAPIKQRGTRRKFCTLSCATRYGTPAPTIQAKDFVLGTLSLGA